MWLYVQSSGDLFQDKIYVKTGYSGAVPDGKNKPDQECKKDTGPIPRGWYKIGPAESKPTVVSLPLTADDPKYCNPPRDGFLFHGDNTTGTASTGCIVVDRKTREKIRDSGDTRLRVVRDSVYSIKLKQRRTSKSSDLI
jgi:hypothetical protein